MLLRLLQQYALTLISIMKHDDSYVNGDNLRKIL